MDLMNTEVIAGLSVLHLTIAIIVVFAVGIGLQSLRKQKLDGEALIVRANCPACGWSGRVSKHQRKCPQCNGELSAV